MACTTAMKVEVIFVWWCRVFRAVITAWGWEGRGRPQQGPGGPLRHTCVVMDFTDPDDVISGQVARKSKLGVAEPVGSQWSRWPGPHCTGAQDSPGSGGEGHLFWAEDASHYLLHDDSEDPDLPPRTLCAPPTVTQFPHFLPHLVHVSLQCRSIRQKLVVQPGFLHCLFHIVAEP